VQLSPLYVRLSGLYFWYFATLGVILPYWSLYLRSLGFEPARIGELLSITLATKIIAPNIWGWIADHTGQRMVLVRLACLATGVCFAGVYLAQDSFWRHALVGFLFSFFWNAALPQFEANTFNHLGADAHRYSAIRLWGSIGFIVAAMLVGPLLERWGIATVPAFLLLLFALLWLNSLAVPDKAVAVSTTLHEPLGRVLRQPRVLALLAICFLNQASHGVYYGFISVYLESLGYSRSVIGGLWALGVIAEVVVFMLMHRLLPRFGPRRLMQAIMALTCLRWLLIAGFAEYWPILLFAQTLHAFSFGMYHAVAIYLINRFFTGANQGRGQALYSSLSFGAGGAVGSLSAGYLWAAIGPQGAYTLAAGMAGLAWLVAWRGLRV